MLIGILIPCLNEAQIIQETISVVLTKLDQNILDGNEIVVIIVDDGSTDATYDLAREAGAHILYRHETNRGLGAATRSGMEIAHYIGCDVVAKFDADLQHDIEDLLPAVRPLMRNECDILYASRFSGKIHYKMPIIRKLGNLFFTKVMRILTGWNITDAQTGLMCFSRRYLTIFEMPSTYNPPQQALFDAKKKGMRYGEVSAQFYPRKTGQSFISLKYIYKVFSGLLKLSFYHHCFKFFAFIGIFLLALGGAIFLIGLVGFLRGLSDQYLPHGFAILILIISSVISVLLGLLSYAILSRQSVIRNFDRYLYIDIEKIYFNGVNSINSWRSKHV